MGILPEKRSKQDGPPPLVVYWREVIRSSRVGRFVARHKTASAAVAGLWAVSKAWKWVIFDFWRWGTHPGGTFHWLVHHGVIAAAASVAIFLVAFAVSHLGLDWLTSDDSDAPPKREIEPPAHARLPRAL